MAFFSNYNREFKPLQKGCGYECARYLLLGYAEISSRKVKVQLQRKRSHRPLSYQTSLLRSAQKHVALFESGAYVVIVLTLTSKT